MDYEGGVPKLSPLRSFTKQLFYLVHAPLHPNNPFTSKHIDSNPANHKYHKLAHAGGMSTVSPFASSAISSQEGRCWYALYLQLK